MYMRSEKSYFRRLGLLTDLLLFLVNSIGIAGALIQVLEIPWATRDLGTDVQGSIAAAESIGNSVSRNAAAGMAVQGMEQGLFWGGLFLICASVLLLRSEKGSKRTLWRGGVCVVLYLFLAVIFRERLLTGLCLALQNVVRNLNTRYLFHITLPLHTALPAGVQPERLMTLSVLFFLYPLELLGGFLWNRGRMSCLLLGNLLWLSAAFVCDVFPNFFFLTFCVLGITGAMVQQEYRGMPEAGLLATAWILAVAGCCIGMVHFVLLPVVEEGYETMREHREDFYRVVNEDWIPRLQNALPAAGYGLGGGPDVTGALNRKTVFSYTSSGVYSVTVDRIPEETLYLKGFVGGTYGEEAWEAWPDRQLERYYEEHGLELPSDYAALPNLSYVAAGAVRQSMEDSYIGIRELGGRGSYSIYPYGALLTEEFKVYGDGSVARRGKEYGFRYRFPEGFGGGNTLPEEWGRLEENYRQYVYDNFLEYPREDLPVLTARLDQEGLGRGGLYSSLLEVMTFLSHQASYNLDVGRNPSDTDFVEYFLFQSHEGYCVHFATSAVLILRYLGIPARYATGYVVSPADFSSGDGNTYTAIVTGKQAHAWAEIYLDTIGWVPVEMTPGAVALADDNRLEQAANAGRLAGEIVWSNQDALSQAERDWWSREEAQEEETLDRPERGEEPSALEEMEKAQQETEQVTPKEDALNEGTGQVAGTSEERGISGRTDKGRQAMVMKLLFAAFIPGVLAFVVFTGRKRQRKRWLGMVEPAGTREEIFLLYRNLRKVLSAAGCSRRLRIDGNGFWNAFSGICPQVSREEYESFCVILAKNSFADREPSEEELREVRRLYERIIREAYDRVPVYRKLFVVKV